jgi:hypothetical protein
MALFQEMEKVFNRAPVAISIRFDGQDLNLPPGESLIPKVTVPFGKNQNPIMGSHDADNPHITGGDYLIGVVGRDNCEPLTKEEWESHCSRPCRIDEVAFFEDKMARGEHLVVRGKGRKTQAKSAFDAGVRQAAPETFASEGD